MCARNDSGGITNKHLKLVELRLEDIESICSPEFISQLDKVILCGNYGDPMMATDTLPILKYFRKHNPDLILQVHTNGSGQSQEWWMELASIVSYCQFGIDGLADTNHLHRRRTNWNKIMSSASSFINAGGKAGWEFIVFKHNEHQIEEAVALAKTMGFSRFCLRKTNRFFSGGSFRPKFTVLNRSGEREFDIFPADSKEYLNPASVRIDEMIKKGTDYVTYLRETEISCEAKEIGMLYLSAEGLVFPCPFTGTIYSWTTDLRDNQVLKMLSNYGGIEAIDAKKKKLSEIVNGPVFQQGFFEGQKRGGGRLNVCAYVCGECMQVKSQYTTSLI